MDSVFFLIAGVASIGVAALLGRRKWDGLLQWILIIQNLFICSIMFIRAAEHWGWVSPSTIATIAAVLFATIQITLFSYLIRNLKELGGSKGDTGERGLQGPKGDTGEQGIQGIQGKTGIQGKQGKSS